MACAGKFLNPIRQSLSLIASSSYSQISHSRQLLNGKSEIMKAWVKKIEPSIHSRCSKLNLDGLHIRSVCLSGSKSRIRCMVGVSSIIGCMSFSSHSARAMDGLDILVDDQDFLGDSDADKDSHALWMFMRKFWLPAFFLVTVLVNWGHPMILVIEVALFLLGTKPSPLSVYVFVEQLCHQCMQREPYLYFLKSLYAKKVEVQDYKLFCLAKVEVKDQKLTLLGILGGWWHLPLSQGAFSVWENKLVKKAPLSL